MDMKKLAAELVEKVGGKENISAHIPIGRCSSGSFKSGT